MVTNLIRWIFHRCNASPHNSHWNRDSLIQLRRTSGLLFRTKRRKSHGTAQQKRKYLRVFASITIISAITFSTGIAMAEQPGVTVIARREPTDGAKPDTNEATPQDAVAYYDRGNARYRQGDLEGAIADYTQAIELNPQFAEAYTVRGIVRHEQGNLEGAIEDYDQAIELNPKNVLVYGSRGLAYQALERYEEALADMNQAIQLGLEDVIPLRDEIQRLLDQQ